MTRVFLNSVRINNLNKVDFINLLIVICLYLHFNTTQVWFQLGVMRTSDILRQVSVAFFRLKILSFFWQKLFVDDKNILSNFENLPNWAIVVWRGTRISNSNNVNDAREGKKKRKEMSREKAKYLLIHIVGLGCSPSDPLPDKHANQIIYYQDRNISFQHQKQCDHISFFSCTRVK